MTVQTIAQDTCPVCLSELLKLDAPCFAHAPSAESRIHALCQECFHQLRGQHQRDTIQCPICRQVIAFTEAREGQVVAVDLDRPEMLIEPADVDEAFLTAIENRNMDQARNLIRHVGLSEEVILNSFINAIEVFHTDEETANLIYFSGRLNTDIMEWHLDSGTYWLIEEGRLRLS